MVSARHSSTHFLMQSWNPVIAALVPFVPSRFQAHFRNVAGKAAKRNISNMGGASMAGQGTTNATLTIENKMGMAGRNPTLDAKRNAAAHRILGPVLQSAIDRNFQTQMKIAAERGLLDLSPRLRQLGFMTR